MSRKASDQVHRLIRSMDAAEKRYFKLYAGRHLIQGQSNHLLLFSAIAAMEEYDEEALLRRFKGRGFTARFAIAKQRLHNTILESLSAYHAHSSVDARLRRRMHEVEVLYQRALYVDAERHLAGVERLAAKHEKFHVLAEDGGRDYPVLCLGVYAFALFFFRPRELGERGVRGHGRCSALGPCTSSH